MKEKRHFHSISKCLLLAIHHNKRFSINENVFVIEYNQFLKSGTTLQAFQIIEIGKDTFIKSWHFGVIVLGHNYVLREDLGHHTI